MVSFPESVTDFRFRIPPATEPEPEEDVEEAVGIVESMSNRFFKIGTGLRSSELFLRIGLGRTDRWMTEMWSSVTLVSLWKSEYSHDMNTEHLNTGNIKKLDNLEVGFQWSDFQMVGTTIDIYANIVILATR